MHLNEFETETPSLFSKDDDFLFDTKKHEPVINMNNCNISEEAYVDDIHKKMHIPEEIETIKKEKMKTVTFKEEVDEKFAEYDSLSRTNSLLDRGEEKYSHQRQTSHDSRSDDAANTESLSVQKSLDDFLANLLVKDNSSWSKGEGDRSGVNDVHKNDAFDFTTLKESSDENEETHGMMDSVVSDISRSFENYDDQNSCDKSLDPGHESFPEPKSTKNDEASAITTVNQFTKNTTLTTGVAVQPRELISSSINDPISKGTCQKMLAAERNMKTLLPNTFSNSCKHENEIGNISVTNAVSLRQAIYQNWYQKRLNSACSTGVANSHKKAEETKKRSTEANSHKENHEAFEAWKQKKLAYYREQLQEKKKEEENSHKKTEEIEEKKKSSEKVFEAWKSEKEIRLRKELEKITRKQREEQLKKKLEEEEKRKASKQAYLSWKKNKEANICEDVQRKRRREIERRKTKQREEQARLERAREAYFQWELRKISSLENLNLSSCKDSPAERFPWRPPSARPNPLKHFVIN